MGKFDIKIDNRNFTIVYSSVSTVLAAEIDNCSFVDDTFSEMKHFKAIIDNVEFKIIENNQTIYKNPSDQKLRFDIAFQIAKKISENTYCSKEEIQNFKQLCERFLNKQSQQMPAELLIASNIFNQLIQLGYKDMQNIENKRYEKINIALQLLKDCVS
jgi:hypothetical protein